MERVCHLTNKIYREMLCITRHEGTTNITVGGLGHVQVSTYCPTPQYRIVLSWDLLAWISVEGIIPCSFTNFITTPELSGPLYISPDIYHTQITEIFWCKHIICELFSLCIKYLPNYYSVRPSESNRVFIIPYCHWTSWEHLSRALPTEMIFDLLRSIRSERLMHDRFKEPILDTLEIIIKWLQVSVSECNQQTPQTKNPICV